MLVPLSKFLPVTVLDWPWWVVAALFVAGLVAWIRGVHFSRPLLTITIIVGAAALGMKLPKMLGWGMEPMAAAILLAVVGGLIGFCLHRWCIGLLLTSLGAGVAGLLTMLLRGLPPLEWATSRGFTAEAISGWWKEMSGQLAPVDAHALAIAVGVVVVVATLLTIFSHKWATCLLWSLLGISCVVFSGAWLIRSGQWPGLSSLPGSVVVQTMVAGLLVSLGSGIQAGSLRTPPAAGPVAEPVPADSNNQTAKPAA